jgi:hypothetical protein
MNDYSELPGLLGHLFCKGLEKEYEGSGIDWGLRQGLKEAEIVLPIHQQPARESRGLLWKKAPRKCLRLTPTKFWQDLVACRELQVHRGDVFDDVSQIDAPGH